MSNSELPDVDADPKIPDHERTETLCLPILPYSLAGGYEDETCNQPPSTPRTPRAIVPSGGYAADSTPSYNARKALRRRVKWNSMARLYSSDGDARCEPPRSLPDLRAAANRAQHEIGSSKILSPGAADQMPLNDTIHEVDMWDTSVKLCTIVTMAQSGAIEIHHHAQLSVTIPKRDISSTRISIGLCVINSLQRDHTCYLESGQSSLFFGPDVSLSSSDRHGAGLKIIRHIHDAEKPLNIYFFYTYPIASHDPSVLLPSFRPTTGKVISESISVAEPMPPLVIRKVGRDDYSSWKSSQHAFNGVLHFERMEMPPLFPEGFKDDIRIKIMVPDPILYRSLGEISDTNVVWDLKIEVQMILGLRLDCRMSLWLEVGAASTLITTDSHGWVPNYFLIDKRLATTTRGEWRQHEGRSILFKQADMLPGPIKLEMIWQEPTEVQHLDGNRAHQLLLPRVVDKEVLGGSFTCGNIGSVSFNNPGVKNNLFRCDEGAEIRFPTLHKGYSLHLSRVPNRSQVPLSSVKESVDISKDPDPESHARDGCEQISYRDDEAATTSHPSLRALILQILIAWALVASVFLGAESIRRRDGCKRDMVVRNGCLTVKDEATSFEGAKLDFAPKKSASIGVVSAIIEEHDDEEEEEEEGEGWRDWMDTALGWKGYTP